MKMHYNSYILAKQNSKDGTESIAKRKHVSGSHLDISRIEFEISQQEKHKELQEEAMRISQESRGSLTPQPQRARNTIQIPQSPKRVKKSSSQKALLKAQRAKSQSDDENIILPALSLPQTPPTRSRISRHSSSSLLTDALLSPTGKLKKESSQEPKSPKRDPKKKSLKSFIKTIEKSVVQSPRRVKRNCEIVRVDAGELNFPDFRQEPDCDALDSASFILSPKAKNTATLRPKQKNRSGGRQGANRSHSMSLNKNEKLQLASRRAESDGEGVLSAPETTLSALVLSALDAEDERTEPEECDDDILSPSHSEST